MSFNPSRYQGLWYEFARTNNLKWEQNCVTATAEYKWNSDIRQMAVKNSCFNPEGNLIYSREAVATPTDDPFVFDILFNDGLPSDPKSNYVVESTDYINYSIVTSYKQGKIDNLWFLTRVSMPQREVIVEGMTRVKSYGINPETLRVNYIC